MHINNMKTYVVTQSFSKYFKSTEKHTIGIDFLI